MTSALLVRAPGRRLSPGWRPHTRDGNQATLHRLGLSPGGGSHAEFIADVLDRMAADTETIDWWERATPRRQ